MGIKNRLFNTSKDSSAFTIIELLVIIAVIGILVTISVVGYGGWRKSTLENQVKSDLIAAGGAMENARNFDNRYPATIPSTISSSDGSPFNGGGSTDGKSYCIDKSSDEDATIKFFISSTNVGSGPQAGTCSGSFSGGIATTIAGSTMGFADGTGSAAQFSILGGMTIDSAGSMYVADAGNHRIRKVTPAGVVTTIAGSTQGYTDGTGAGAQFNSPIDLAVDPSGNVYVVESSNNRIRKVTPAGVVTTIAGSTSGYADGTGTSAQFNSPVGIAIDSSGNLYVSDGNNNRIRKVTPAGVVTTIVGSTSGYADGTGTSAQFNSPRGIDIDSTGNLYITDYMNDRIRKVTPAGVVTTIAGSTSGYADGTGTSAQFSLPAGIVVDATNTLFVTDMANQRVRKISPAGIVTTIAGSGVNASVDGTGTGAQFSYPYGIVIDPNGALYISEYLAFKIRKVV